MLDTRRETDMPTESGGRAARRASTVPARPIRLLLVPAVLLTLVLVACEPAQETAVDEVLESPASMMGQGVTVSGEVDTLLTERALTLRDEGSGGQLLVLVRPTAIMNGINPTGVLEPVGQIIQSGDTVQIIGTVDQFEREAMAEDLGMVLNEELFASWDGGEVLVADQLDVSIPAGSPDPDGT
jgi:hypothetical protein